MNKSFTFHTHRHKVQTNKTNGDSSVTFEVDREFKGELAPFMFLDADTPLIITISDGNEIQA